MSYEAVWVGADDELLRHGQVVDVSERGIGLETSDLLVPGQVVVLKVRDSPHLPALSARVAWTDEHRAGLAVLRERPEGAAAWRDAFAVAGSVRSLGQTG